MKYFLIAGEASGDLLGAGLMRGIREKDTEAEFRFWGGDAMLSVAPGLQQHFRDIAIMGFVEVVMNLKKVLGNITKCRQQILDYKPDVVILIDYPGFNLRMAKFAKENGFKTCYFIAPKIWAWNEKRGKKLEKYVDLLLLIFPFEVEYFKKWKVNSEYVGNPLVQQIRAFKPDPGFRSNEKLGTNPIIALLPGSRKQEIKRILPVMTEVAASYPGFTFVIAGAPGISPEFYLPWLSSQVKILYGKTHELLAASAGAVVCSGTATLETAIFNVPQVCGYIASPISYRIARAFVKIKYISLVNLNMDKPVIRELIQDEMTPENVRTELNRILPGGPGNQAMIKDYQELSNLFGTTDAAGQAALLIRKLLNR